MKKIATLGPAGTFSELGAKKYLEKTNSELEIKFYPTISKVYEAIGKECEFGIIPIENTLDGYVKITLDLLIQTELQIINETVLPIQFSFVGNASDISEINKLYAQFKTQGQCFNFLEKHNNIKVITTESNGQSFEEAKKGVLGEAAIIPQYLLKDNNNFSIKIDDVTDSLDNETRFIVLSKELKEYKENLRYKTSLVIMDAEDDKPGVLAKILNEFSLRDINLTSIISCPTKKALGKYYFFIDIEGHHLYDENIQQAIDEIRNDNVVTVLGSYSRL